MIEYKVNAKTAEELVDMLHTLGQVIQHSAQTNDPVVFSKSSLMNFGERVQAFESEVRKQREPVRGLFT